MATLVWFRNDLRVHDNPALWQACKQDDDVQAVFLVTRNQWALHDMAPLREQFLHDQVNDLRHNLAQRGIPLHIKNAGDFRGSVTFVLETAVELGANTICFNEEYELNERLRDDKVRAGAQALGMEVRSFHDQCLVPPGTLFNQQGAYFRVYTPFRRACVKRLETQDLKPLPAPKRKQAPIKVPSCAPWNTPSCEAIVYWPATEREAQRRLRAFVDNRVMQYKNRRDFPAQDATSTLSPYLAVGAISLRQCLHAARMEGDGSLEPTQTGLQTWINELLWREFYRHITFGFPETCRHQAFQADTDLIPWRGVSPLFDAWCQGQTGYPLVDAGMRQLLALGWMHNRLRMVTAMFLTKHLFTDWRLGEKFFMQHLVDGDFSANNGGWQWSASTGADAAPYFRVFNPTLQSKRFDESGEFIRKWVPELSQLSDAEIHAPSPLIARSSGYPLPVVEHREATDRVKQQFAQIGSLRAQRSLVEC